MPNVKSRIDSNPPRPLPKSRVNSNPPRQAKNSEPKRWSQVKAKIDTKGGDVHRRSREEEERVKLQRERQDRLREEIRKRQQARLQQRQKPGWQGKQGSGVQKQSRPSGQSGDQRRGGKGRSSKKSDDVEIEKMGEEEQLNYFKAQEWDEPKKTGIGRLCQCCRRQWRWCQGYYPPRGGAPVPPPPLYQPPNAAIKDTGWARQLKAAMDIRVIRYPEPFAELLLTSNYLEPKNYKIIVNRKVLFYSYDYTPYISNVTHYIQPFSQIILDPEDTVTLYQECYKFPNEVMCCIACLDCRKIQINRNQVIYYMRAPNGFYMGKIERNRPCAHCRFSTLSLDIYNRKDELILFVTRRSGRKFFIKSAKGKTRVGVIRRRSVPESKHQLFPNHYDYKILLDDHSRNEAEVKFLIIGATFFIDFLLDKYYRGFIRYGSRQIPTFNSRYSQ